MKTACLIVVLVAVLAVSSIEALNCPETGFFPDARNCQGYTMCYKNPLGTGLVGVQMRCPKGMAFERNLGYCSRVAIEKYCIPGNDN